MSITDKQAESIKQIKNQYESGKFEVNGNEYGLIKMPYKKARKIFAYMSLVGGDIESGRMDFLDSAKFENEIEPLLMQYLTNDGCKLSTMDDYFDECMEDSAGVIAMAMQLFSSPFLSVPSTSSNSKAQEGQRHTLKKPM